MEISSHCTKGQGQQSSAPEVRNRKPVFPKPVENTLGLRALRHFWKMPVLKRFKSERAQISFRILLLDEARWQAMEPIVKAMGTV